MPQVLKTMTVRRGFAGIRSTSFWHFDTEADDYVVPSGKYAHNTLSFVLETDPDYCRWLISRDNVYMRIPRKVKDVIVNFIDELIADNYKFTDFLDDWGK